MKMIKIPYNKQEKITVHEIPECSCLDAIKQLIGIEWAEIVVTNLRVPDLHRDFVLIVDEIGKLKEGWQEKINLRASLLYNGFPTDPIVGNVVLCAREWTQSFGECDLAGLLDCEVEVLKDL